MENIKSGVIENNSKSKKILGMNLYTGFIEVRENGQYIYSSFCPSTRLHWDDAKLDADIMKMELEEQVINKATK